MMELTDKQQAEEERALPRNLRQVGEPGTDRTVLIEDYAYTYLRQLAEDNLTGVKTAILAGHAETGPRVYVQAAFGVDMGQEQKDWFSNEHWREIFKELREWFDGMEILGWYLSDPGFPPRLSEELTRLHGRHFPGPHSIFLQMDALANEETFYLQGDNGLKPLCGYYIYYERNDRMQAYMSRQRGGMGIEPEGIVRDRAATRFRTVMQERREQSSQRKAMTLLYTACTFLAMVILVIGVTLINNYDRMASMEDTLSQISVRLQEEETREQSVESAALEENMQAAEKKEGEAETPDKDASSDADAQDEDDVDEEPPAQEETQEEQPDAASDGEPETYQVRKGDTLLEICRRHYGSDEKLREICELNGVEDGDKIYAGQTIVLP